MKTIKCNITLKEDGKLVLEDLPIEKGKKVKVMVTVIDDEDEKLQSMAFDPEIQREIKNIADEFAVTENDGLEKE